MLTPNNIQGTWKLESFVIEKDGMATPWRQGAYGLLIYTFDGHMSVSINVPKTDPEWSRFLLFYAGTYKIDDNNLIIHQVRNAINPARVGEQLVRKASLVDKKLRLIASDPNEGKHSSAVLTWVKTGVL